MIPSFPLLLIPRGCDAEEIPKSPALTLKNVKSSEYLRGE